MESTTHFQALAADCVRLALTTEQDTQKNVLLWMARCCVSLAADQTARTHGVATATPAQLVDPDI